MKSMLALTGVDATAVTYRFVGGSDCGYRGWALCTVNDATGELLITSDWGNWGHNWGTRHLGRPSLTAFLGDRDPESMGTYDYIAMKLLGKASAYSFDPEATVSAIRAVILEQRREGRIDRDDARCAWERVEEIAFDCGSSEMLFLERCSHEDDLDPIGIYDLHEYTRHEHSSEYRDLTTIVLPALVAACAATARARGEIGADHG